MSTGNRIILTRTDAFRRAANSEYDACHSMVRARRLRARVDEVHKGVLTQRRLEGDGRNDLEQRREVVKDDRASQSRTGHGLAVHRDLDRGRLQQALERSAPGGVFHWVAGVDPVEQGDVMQVSVDGLGNIKLTVI